MTTSAGHGTSLPIYVKSKLDATAAPTVNDDVTAEYSVGSHWIDVTNDTAYVCVDTTAGAAVWVQVGGSGAGLIGITDTDNTALGLRALDSLTTGTLNVVLGEDAGAAITSGNNNVLAGRNAGNSITEGARNVILGAATATALTTGNYNVVAGDQALVAVITGASNIAIGANAGQSALGSFNIFLGHDAGKNETGSNTLYIDVSSTATPLIGGDFSARTVTMDAVLKARVAVNAQTGTTYPLVASDSYTLVTMSNASANTLTIPKNTTTAIPVNTRIEVVQGLAGVTTITGATGVTLNGVSAGSGAINTQYQGVVLTKIATDVWLMSGDHAVVA